MQPDNRPTTTPSNKASFFMFSPDQSNCITGLTAKGRDLNKIISAMRAIGKSPAYIASLLAKCAPDIFEHTFQKIRFAKNLF